MQKVEIQNIQIHEHRDCTVRGRCGLKKVEANFTQFRDVKHPKCGTKLALHFTGLSASNRCLK